MTMSENTKILTKKELIRGWARYYATAEVSNSYERLTALGFGYGMAPIVEKLYEGDPEQIKEAYKRHITFYNSEATWGSLIFGIVCALEQENANAANNDQAESQLEEVDATEMITNIKIGLMGPLAGIGDSIDVGTVRPIILSLFIPLAKAGNIMGGILPLIVWCAYMTLLAYFLVREGYTLGKDSVAKILQSGKVKKLIDAAGVLGLFMMGALSASYISLQTTFAIKTSGGKFLIQDTLDKILPNLLPLAAVFLIYFYIKRKGPKYLQVVLGVLVISLLLSFLGIV